MRQPGNQSDLSAFLTHSGTTWWNEQQADIAEPAMADSQPDEDDE